MQGVNLDTAHVHAFTQIHNYRDRREQEMSQPRDTAYPARPWEPLTRTPGAPAPGGIPAPQELPREFMNYASDMATHHRTNDARIQNERDQRRIRIATRLAQQMADTDSIHAESAQDNDTLICAICVEAVSADELIVTLSCQHTFHQLCCNTWAANVGQPTCPQCRAPIEIVSINPYQPADRSQRYDISTPRDSDASGNVSRNASVSSFQSVASQAFPWWPESLAYHSMTSLPDGRLSIIVDPRAWTNLMGADLARLLVARAIKMGYKPQQLPMETLNVQGVGNGTQQCKFKLECPIASRIHIGYRLP